MSAIRFESAVFGEYLSRTASVLDYNTDYTLMAHVYMVSDTADDAMIFQLTYLTGGLEFYRDWLYLDPTRNLILHRTGSSGEAGDTGSQLAVGTYYHVAIVGTPSELKLYLNGVLNGIAVQAVGSRDASVGMYIGARWTDVPTRPLDGRVSGMRAWQSALTPAEIVTEMSSETAIKAGAWADWQTPAGATRVNDFSGNTRHWTANGTLSDEDGPTYGAAADITTFIDEDVDVRAGGNTIIITLIGSTWIA